MGVDFAVGFCTGIRRRPQQDIHIPPPRGLTNSCVASRHLPSRENPLADGERTARKGGRFKDVLVAEVLAIEDLEHLPLQLLGDALALRH
jgi:hypothetical protein